jgi:hypothetical protein
VDAAQVRDWLLVLSASAALLAVAVSVWLGVRDYRRKLRAEEQLARAGCAETELRLADKFLDLVLLAAGTGRYTRSAALLRHLLRKGVIDEDDFNDPPELHSKVLRMVLMPGTACGPSASAYVVRVIGVLAARHEVLRELGIEALQSERVRGADPERVEQILELLRGRAQPSVAEKGKEE